MEFNAYLWMMKEISHDSLVVQQNKMGTPEKK
jgi:hypothetical protein